MPSIRIERLSKQIKLRVAMVLTRDIADPRMGLVTITRVDLAKDLAHATIHWSTMSEGTERSTIGHALEAATPFVQREVAAIMKTRVTPRLQFKFDDSLERMERISGIIGNALAEDRDRQRERGDYVAEEVDPADADTPSGDAPTDPEPPVSPNEDDPERAG